MSFLYLLEEIRFPGLNELMLSVTKLGEETAFLLLALVIFWCVDKKKGYYLLSVGFLGIVANQFLKLSFRIPRPWVRDPNFTILEQAREAASGYSFPSGHTQTAAGTFGCLAASADKKWWRNICISLAALVGFSRMYIGVHTPADVLVSIVIAAALVLGLKKPIMSGGVKEMKLLIGAMMICAVAFGCYVHFWRFPADMDAHNYESGLKNAYTLLGSIAGMAVVYAADVKWLRFSEKACWWVQIIKVVVGLGLVLAVKEGLRTPLEMILPMYPARAVRYFLIVVMAGMIWPMSFRRLSGLGKVKYELRNN